MNIDTSQLRWHKATASNPNTQCVEVAKLPEGGVAVRDSKNPQGSVLRFTAGEWSAFLDGVDKGEFEPENLP